MNQWRALPVIFLALGAFSSCSSSSPQPTTEEGKYFYQHTFDFMWDEAKATLAKKWRIQGEDRETSEIVTDWDVQLAPMDRFGRRTRLRVKVDGSPEKGYRALATQETEINTNQKDPLSFQQATWEPMESDGNLAMQFLVDFDRRLNPPKAWKDHERR